MEQRRQQRDVNSDYLEPDSHNNTIHSPYIRADQRLWDRLDDNSSGNTNSSNLSGSVQQRSGSGSSATLRHENQRRFHYLDWIGKPNKADPRGLDRNQNGSGGPRDRKYINEYGSSSPTYGLSLQKYGYADRASDNLSSRPVPRACRSRPRVGTSMEAREKARWGCHYGPRVRNKNANYQRLADLPYSAVYFGLVNDTTAHGISHIHLSNGCWKRVFWLLITLTMIGAWTWNTYLILQAFLRFDVTVSVDIRSVRELDFPAVTICNQNPVRYSQILSDPNITDLLGIPMMQPGGPGGGPMGPGGGPPPGGPPPGPAGGGPLGGPAGQGNVPPGPGGGPWRPPPPSDHRASKRGKEGLGNKLPRAKTREQFVEMLANINFEVKEKYGHQFNDLVLQCTYHGYQCGRDSFLQFYDSVYGNCFTFNSGSGYTEVDPNGEVIGNGTKQPLKANFPGPIFGLKLLLNIEQKDYVGALTHQAGARVVVHPRHRPPFSQQNGVDVSPGSATAVGITKVMMDRLGKGYDNCTDSTLNNSLINVYETIYPWTVYTLEACQKTCYQKRMMSECKCHMDNIPNVGLAFEGIGNVPGCKTSVQGNCVFDVESAYNNGTLNCPCTQPCSEQFFTYSVSQSKWPSENYMPLLFADLLEASPALRPMLNPEKTAENFLVLDVFYEVLNYQYLSESPAYEPSQFVSDIGGAVGLWVGASILTTFEYGEFLLDLLVLCCAKAFCGGRRAGNKQDMARERGMCRDGDRRGGDRVRETMGNTEWYEGPVHRNNGLNGIR